MSNPESNLGPDFPPAGVGYAIPTAEDMKPSAPRWQRPTLFSEGPLGPWSWPALEGARERHLAALDALAAARESEDAEAEREALIEVCDATVEGVRACRMTHGSAKDAYDAAVEAVRASIPVDGAGFVPNAEQDRARAIQREAGEWTGADVATLRRCWQMGEADTFRPDGSLVAPLIAEVEAFRESLDDAAGLTAKFNGAPSAESGEDRAAA